MLLQSKLTRLLKELRLAMLQIRHMVGASVLVARQAIPLDLVVAALRRPSRASFPLAPAQVQAFVCTAALGHCASSKPLTACAADTHGCGRALSCNVLACTCFR